MAIFPLDKYLLADYREQLRTNDAPQDVDTEVPILPVIPISQPLGFPKPNSKQVIRTYVLNKGADFDTQVATVSSNTNIYFLGAFFRQTTATAQSIIYDATSGTKSITDGDTVTLAYNATANILTYFPIYPVKVISGIRVSGTVAAGTNQLIVYYIEERII